MTRRATTGTRAPARRPPARGLLRILGAGIFLLGAAGSAVAGGDWCDGAPPGSDRCFAAAPPVYVFGYDYSAAPRWTSNGWSSPPTRPVPVPPPGPFYYAPPVYPYPHASCRAGCGEEGLLLFPWDRRR